MIWATADRENVRNRIARAWLRLLEVPARRPQCSRSLARSGSPEHESRGVSAEYSIDHSLLPTVKVLELHSWSIPEAVPEAAVTASSSNFTAIGGKQSLGSASTNAL